MSSTLSSLSSSLRNLETYTIAEIRALVSKRASLRKYVLEAVKTIEDTRERAETSRLLGLRRYHRASDVGGIARGCLPRRRTADGPSSSSPPPLPVWRGFARVLIPRLLPLWWPVILGLSLVSRIAVVYYRRSLAASFVRANEIAVCRYDKDEYTVLRHRDIAARYDLNWRHMLELTDSFAHLPRLILRDEQAAQKGISDGESEETVRDAAASYDYSWRAGQRHTQRDKKRRASRK